MCKKNKFKTIFQVKANQKELLINFQHTIKSKPPAYSHTTNLEKARGRIEIRETKTFVPNTTNPNRQGYITDEYWKQNIKVIIQVTRTTKLKNTKESTKSKSIYKPTTIETSYYFTTTGIFTVKELNQFIRNHWSIENKNHYIRDNALNEDKSRIRKNPIIMATIRSVAMNIMRHNQSKKQPKQPRSRKNNSNKSEPSNYQNMSHQIRQNAWSDSFWIDHQWLWRNG